jgi:hypothetical protein
MSWCYLVYHIQYRIWVSSSEPDILSARFLQIEYVFSQTYSETNSVPKLSCPFAPLQEGGLVLVALFCCMELPLDATMHGLVHT